MRYEGNNTKALKSQASLAEALESLMTKKPYDKISVSDMCNKAGISRQTFYNLFGDKTDVLHYSLSAAYEGRLRILSQQESVTLDNIVDEFVYVLNTKRALLEAMNANGLNGIMAEEITRCVSLFANQFVREDAKTELLPYSEAMLAGAISQMLVLWFERGSVLSTDTLANLLRDFMNGHMYTMESE